MILTIKLKAALRYIPGTVSKPGDNGPGNTKFFNRTPRFTNALLAPAL